MTAHGWALDADIDLCRAAAQDAANKAMRTAGRKAWNEDDFDLATDKLDELLKNAAGCLAEGKWMWAANEALYGKLAA